MDMTTNLSKKARQALSTIPDRADFHWMLDDFPDSVVDEVETFLINLGKDETWICANDPWSKCGNRVKYGKICDTCRAERQEELHDTVPSGIGISEIANNEMEDGKEDL